jgi:uncharacterized protein (DUF433 family)
MSEVIVRDGKTGNAIVSSTGTPVDDILVAIESTGTVEGALRLHPALTPEAVGAALRFARVAVRREVKYTPDPNVGNMQVREVALQPYRGGSGGGTVTLEAGEYESMQARLKALEERYGREAVGSDPYPGLRSVQETIQATDDRREQLRRELDVMESIRDGLQEIADGKGIPHAEVFARLTRRFSP